MKVYAFKMVDVLMHFYHKMRFKDLISDEKDEIFIYNMKLVEDVGVSFKKMQVAHYQMPNGQDMVEGFYPSVETLSKTLMGDTGLYQVNMPVSPAESLLLKTKPNGSFKLTTD